MSRTIPAGIDATLDDARVVDVWFLALLLDTDPIYAHTDVGQITVLSQTWDGAGGLGRITAVTETREPRSHGIKVQLQITDEAAGSIFEEVTQQDFFQREAVLYFATRDIVTGALTADPFEIFRGKIDVPEIVHGETESFVEILIESEWATGEDSNGRLMSDAQLQADHPGDLGYTYLEDIQNVKVVWGSRRTVVFSAQQNQQTTPVIPGFTIPNL